MAVIEIDRGITRGAQGVRAIESPYRLSMMLLASNVDAQTSTVQPGLRREAQLAWLSSATRARLPGTESGFHIVSGYPVRTSDSRLLSGKPPGKPLQPRYDAASMMNAAR